MSRNVRSKVARAIANIFIRSRRNVMRCSSAMLLAYSVLHIGLAQADFSGRVVHVQDGDTLTILSSEKKQIKVRLNGIDAPERGQPFGTRATESLRQMCGGQLAHTVDLGRDRYGRTIGRVTCAGMDASEEQVRRGMAWVFTRYVAPDSPLYGVQHQARAGRMGLWADASPTAPWDWRASQRAKSKL
jgi:endonuclease YncB( thermonuclease family)